MYGFSYYVADFLNRVDITVSGFGGLFTNPLSSFGEWVLDTVSMWTEW